MIYRSIEKIILENPNDMELGKKIRRLYLREVADSVDDIIEDGIDDYISVPVSYTHLTLPTICSV